jgi:energy-converting hydrogenase Eha subunit H
MRRRTKWASGLLLVLLSVPLFGAALIFVAMSGGIRSIILNMKARPDVIYPVVTHILEQLASKCGAATGSAI